jgi:hypothetical protein
MFCVICLCNHTCKQFWKPHAICRLTCACQGSQESGEVCSIGAAISRAECPPHTPRWA